LENTVVDVSGQHGGTILKYQNMLRECLKTQPTLRPLS